MIIFYHGINPDSSELVIICSKLHKNNDLGYTLESFLSVIGVVMKNWVLSFLFLSCLPWMLYAESAPAGKDDTLVTYTLPNGYTICLKTVDSFKSDVLVRGIALGGYGQVPASDRASVQLASHIAWESGVGSMDGETLGRQLLQRNMELSLDIEPFYRSIEGSAPVGSEEELFQLISLLFREPRFSSEALKRVRARVGESIRLRQQDPEVVFEDSVRSVNTRNLALFDPLTVKQIESVSLDTAKRFFSNDYLTTTDWTFVVVGRFDQEKMRKLIQKHLGAVPKRQKSFDVVAPPNFKFANGWVKKQLKHSAIQESQTRITLPLNMEFTAETMEQLDLASQVLETRLRECMRKETGSTLGLDVAYELPLYPYVDQPVLMLHFHCAKRSAERLTDLMIQQLVKICQEGPREDELDKACMLRERNEEFWRRRRSYWLSVLSNSAVWGWNLQELNDPDAKCMRNGVQTFLRDHVISDRGTIVTMFPE